MARAFSSASSERVWFGVGGVSANTQSVPMTLAAVLRIANTTGFKSFLVLNNSSAAAGAVQWGMEVNGATLIAVTTSATAGSGPTLTANVPYAIFVTRASGTGLTIRYHLLNLQTGAWSHGNFAGTISPGTSSVASIRVGDFEQNDYMTGDVEMAAIFEANFTDVQCEALGANWQSWLNASPKWMADFRQAAVTDTTRDRTGRGGDEIARNGSTVSSISLPVRYSRRRQTTSIAAAAGGDTTIASVAAVVNVTGLAPSPTVSIPTPVAVVNVTPSTPTPVVRVDPPTAVVNVTGSPPTPIATVPSPSAVVTVAGIPATPDTVIAAPAAVVQVLGIPSLDPGGDSGPAPFPPPIGDGLPAVQNPGVPAVGRRG